MEEITLKDSRLNSSYLLDKITAGDSRLYCRYLIGEVRHLLLKARQKELSPYHIAPRQAFILWVLYNLGHRATLAELALNSERKINNMSTQMSGMEKKGLVKKVKETPGSKLLSFELTKKGIFTYEKGFEMEADRAIMSVLSDEERQQLILLLKKIFIEAEKYNWEPIVK